MTTPPMTRREFGIGLRAAGTGVLGSYGAMAAQPGPQAKPGTAIDQNAIRRRGVGLRGLNAARASAGLTLFAPMMGDGTVYLIDLGGKIVHAWRMPYPPGTALSLGSGISRL